MDAKKQLVKDRERRIAELEGEVAVIGDRYKSQLEELQGKVVDKEKLLEEAVIARKRAEEEAKRWKAEVDRLNAEKQDADALQNQISDRESRLEELRLEINDLKKKHGEDLQRCQQ